MLSGKNLKILEELAKNKDVSRVIGSGEIALINRLIQSYREVMYQVTKSQKGLWRPN